MTVTDKMAARRRKLKKYIFLYRSLKKSFCVFLKETGLHGLKFVGDSKLSIWERCFFLTAFVAAFILTCHLISNIYGKWNSTPVIIGLSPQAMSILSVPFPAITICNMNQVQLSKVAHYEESSNEYEVLKLLCNTPMVEHGDDATVSYPENLANNTLRISDFVSKHSQPCEKMFLYCRFSSFEYDCKKLFREIMTDEGLCCVFNFQLPELLYKQNWPSDKKLITPLGHVPVAWDPESGYPSKLPPKYYPHSAVGTGISLGFTIVLDVQLNEYFCSSTNGPGFKVQFHNPIQTPHIKESALVVGIGYETNFRLEFSSSEAMPSIRGIPEEDRQCIFKDERELIYHKHYSLVNCEHECASKFIYETCACIPYNYPHIYINASVCSVRDTHCIRHAQRPGNSRRATAACREKCFPGCFELTYLADGLYFPLARRDFRIAIPQLANLNKSYLQENIAVVNIYYRESAYYGSLKNVYIGLTEFLSNIGGVMGLFMGFSVISLAEVLYFLILKPISELIAWTRGVNSTKRNACKLNEVKQFDSQNKQIWYTRELYPKGVQTKTFERQTRDKRSI